MLLILGIAGLVAANAVALVASDPYVGIAAIISAIAAGIATVIGAMNRVTIKRTERKTDATNVRVSRHHDEMTTEVGGLRTELDAHYHRVEGAYKRLADVIERQGGGR